MWNCPAKYNLPVCDVNLELSKLEGELEDEQAKITLIDFLRANLGFTVELLMGIKLFPYQEIILKGWFKRNFSMAIISRGGSKSFLAAIFILLYCVFEPNTKVLIAGPTFRTSRAIFSEVEKIISSPGAKLLCQCFTKKPVKRMDLYEYEINGGSVKSVPLAGGDRIRGIRANVLILDETLLLSADVIERILMPFLMASKDIKEKIKIREEEDELIKKGKMKEEERFDFESSCKMIMLSSASFTFEYLYKKYQDWIVKMNSDEEIKDATYFIAQLSYEALPEELWDKTIIEEAKNGGTSHSNFQREYGAQFVDDSAGYFSSKKMELCTIPAGQLPHLEVVGESKCKYILSIDSNFSNADVADNFAMTVIKMDDKVNGSVVHQYAKAGVDLKDHIKYLHYIITNFNIVMIILDSAGGMRFIEAANLSEYFKNSNIELKFFEFDSDKVGTNEYNDVLRDARNEYNLQTKRICIDQKFTSDFIRSANETLQGAIDHGKISFASKINGDGNIFDATSAKSIPLDMTGFQDMTEMIDEQDILIDNVKKECALIEVKSTSKGTQSFDLPIHLQKTKSAKRARKDSYTALFLGTWGVRIYNDILSYTIPVIESTFIPFCARIF